MFFPVPSWADRASAVANSTWWGLPATSGVTHVLHAHAASGASRRLHACGPHTAGRGGSSSVSPKRTATYGPRSLGQKWDACILVRTFVLTLVGSSTIQEWTVADLVEIAKCETDNDAKRVAKNVIAHAKKTGERVTAKLGTIVPNSEGWGLDQMEELAKCETDNDAKRVGESRGERFFHVPQGGRYCATFPRHFKIHHDTSGSQNPWKTRVSGPSGRSHAYRQKRRFAFS